MKTKVGPKLRPHLKIVDWKQGGNAEQAIQQIEALKQRDTYDDLPFADMPFDDEVQY
jgi:hypothetical protein